MRNVISIDNQSITIPVGRSYHELSIDVVIDTDSFKNNQNHAPTQFYLNGLSFYYGSDPIRLNRPNLPKLRLAPS